MSATLEVIAACTVVVAVAYLAVRWLRPWRYGRESTVTVADTGAFSAGTRLRVGDDYVWLVRVVDATRMSVSAWRERRWRWGRVEVSQTHQDQKESR